MERRWVIGSGDPNLQLHLSYWTAAYYSRNALEDYVSIKDFGAIGYDENNPSDTTDDTVAIRAALTSAAKAVYFPSGVYRVSESMRIESAVTIFGDWYVTRSSCMNLLHKSILTTFTACYVNETAYNHEMTALK